jgi:tetratricopeptide (TPR) repeat protein
LGIIQYSRFQRLGQQSDLTNAILNLQKAVDQTVDRYPDKPPRLSNLGICQRHGELSDLDNAISNQKSAVELMADGHPDKPDPLSNLGCSQKLRFQRQGQFEDLKNAILNEEMAIKLTGDEHPHKATYLTNLGDSRNSLFCYRGEEADLEASISDFKAATLLKSAHVHQALAAARGWARTLHEAGKLQSALTGYRVAIEILPKVAWLGLDIPSRQHCCFRRNLKI